MVSSPTGLAWWTFAGDRANAAISQRLGDLTESVVQSGSLSVTANCSISVQRFGEAIDEIRQVGADALQAEVTPEMLDGLKFTSCLPEEMARDILQTRLADRAALTSVLREPCRHTTLTE